MDIRNGDNCSCVVPRHKSLLALYLQSFFCVKPFKIGFIYKMDILITSINSYKLSQLFIEQKYKSCEGYEIWVIGRSV